jgi:hypothetical protein
MEFLTNEQRVLSILDRHIWIGLLDFVFLGFAWNRNSTLSGWWRDIKPTHDIYVWCSEWI